MALAYKKVVDMVKKLNIITVLLLFVLYLVPVNISTAAVSPDDLKKIEAAIPAEATVTPKRPRKLLIFNLAIGYRHSSIDYGAAVLQLMGKKTGAFEVVQIEDMSVFEPNNLAQFDAVCLNSSSGLKFTDPQRRALLDFIKEGKGIVGIHAAINNFQNWPEAAEMMGGTFGGHPWTKEGTWPVKIEDPNHPVTAAFNGKDFKINEEIYRIKTINLRKNCRVLLSLDMTDNAVLNAKGVRPTDKDVPISWVRSFQKGRLFYCSFGENHHIFSNPVILRHYLDGIQFAFGDLPADTTPSFLP